MKIKMDADLYRELVAYCLNKHMTIDEAIHKSVEWAYKASTAPRAKKSTGRHKKVSRKFIAKLLELGISPEVIAKNMRISLSMVYLARRQMEEKNTLEKH